MSDTYAAVAHFAQSWGLLYFFIAFIVIVVLVMRPSRKRAYEEMAKLPLRED
ncbi:MAG: cbb3-type cytochrome c oxidase subunit 3 [Bauldia sp.]|nr:MAG: cbb3-type cytochrome c oxidase subunit 3 [Bauldia sp.]MBZ0227987.1 cbb3-type cytochrome c oxidase subunit 3 [Bauldia sp.]